MPYGVANKTGQPDIGTATEIIKTAWENGIQEFDTAQAYGDSEIVLGHALTSLCLTDKARIITKLDPNLDHRDSQSLEMAVGKSLRRLKVNSLYGLMLHREAWLDNRNSDLEDVLLGLLRKGIVQHIGVSLYSHAKALHVLKSEIFDMIQIPANILDRRFVNVGVFQRAEEQGKQVYIRSVFLQGLLLMNLEDLPQRMLFAKPALVHLDQVSQKYRFTPLQIALIYVKQKYPSTKLLFGAESIEQVEQNIEAWKGSLPDQLMKEIEEIFFGIDEKIVDPAKWPA